MVKTRIFSPFAILSNFMDGVSKAIDNAILSARKTCMWVGLAYLALAIAAIVFFHPSLNSFYESLSASPYLVPMLALIGILLSLSSIFTMLLHSAANSHLPIPTIKFGIAIHIFLLLIMAIFLYLAPFLAPVPFLAGALAALFAGLLVKYLQGGCIASDWPVGIISILFAFASITSDTIIGGFVGIALLIAGFAYIVPPPRMI